MNEISTTVSERVLVTAAIAPLLRSPAVSAEQTSQALHGHRLDVLGREGSWLQVQSADGYRAWMYEGYSRPVTREEEREMSAGERFSLGCVLRDAAGRLPLPFGALITASSDVDGGVALSSAERARSFPREPGAIADSALRYFEGAPYLWGGLTPWGVDCSGFVQAVFALHGVSMPRDSRDQADAGDPAPLEKESLHELQPADLLFFSDREDARITHVAIATGANAIVHAALGRGGYHREDLRRVGDSYVRALIGRLVRITRPLRALGTSPGE
jgi:hypothetical protein